MGAQGSIVADHRRKVADCLTNATRYTDRELEFLRSIEHAPRTTEAQDRWLANLVDPIDFDKINSAALAALPVLAKRWLPDGRLSGKEWIARNPTRADSSPGSFSINITTGRWADFATPDRGGDVVALAAYIHFAGDQFAAARALRRMLAL